MMRKEWWELESEYQRRYLSGLIPRDIWKYIPKKYAGAVKNAFADTDGYWVWLDNEEGGWRAYDGGEDCGIIHEYTLNDLKAAIKTIRRYK